MYVNTEWALCSSSAQSPELIRGTRYVEHLTKTMLSQTLGMGTLKAAVGIDGVKLFRSRHTQGT
jgi:hypothetical protein